jgi:hypothetical protein
VPTCHCADSPGVSSFERRRVQFGGAVSPSQGCSVRRRTVGLTITSTVQQLRHDQCFRWSGPAIGDGLGIDGGIHIWTFTPVDGGVLVRTEENWHGAQVEADVPTSTHFLGAGLEAWLADLRTAAEG